MTRGVRLYLVGSFVLVSLAGCGRGFFQAEREPWRAEAEAACLKSGAVKESADIVRIDPISGPGQCGAEFPLKVAAIGEASSSYGFADEELRPPVSIGNQPRWPVTQPRSNYPQSQNYPAPSHPPRSNYPESALQQPSGYGTSTGPMSLNAPGVVPQEDEIDLPPEGTDAAGAARYMNAPSYPARPAGAAPYGQPPAQQPLPRLGPAQGNPVTAVGPVAIKPTATLACPIVSELDRWLADTVQPSAMRWFGVRVAEIKQISAYSCRGMNGNSRAHISEHAFGNALDISAFVLADGRRVTVKDGWRGMPEEQGFLRDVQSGACAHFTTVLAPGSNVYHYDHIHVDLMRRASRRLICQPAAVSGDEVAARAQSRSPYANARDPSVTGSLGRKSAAHKREEDEYADD
ncbi:extensin family protein [Bradyrhizobium sp. 182]|uniref:extensin-like domain-containing protein n=1 Tax=unclassified Bradyrhizobium TaxID=2631580 RepID=UPI001FF97DAD|nr:MULTISPECIES: extensin family protein [unclassified Bradyrhizobium]MCK1422041.1 extensin family protein [Bradyrhizobium sp. CW12]MCK1528790.1 extensin family protein [Bradyrhizobium sp. 182]MCK1598130.1 extensin family protein [Bradyrhizobium sp. 164]MCK1648633.1 extensin family protein [Bradyrhizobium sp. 154]MCK1666740.1 extensin family protein [Bradyrhizobium sp. 153]